MTTTTTTNNNNYEQIILIADNTQHVTSTRIKQVPLKRKLPYTERHLQSRNNNATRHQAIHWSNRENF